MTDQRPDPLSDPGVPTLLRRLSDFTGESVYLWYSPPPTSDRYRWRVWTGAPAGTSGGEWGAGPTPYGALQAAFEHVVRSTFDGRLGGEPESRPAEIAESLFVAAREAVDAFGRGDDDARKAGAYRLLDAAVRSYAAAGE